MKLTDAIRHAYELHRVWVSAREVREGKGYDLARVHKSMLQEYRYQRTLSGRVALAREIHGELVLLGKVRKALTR
jgi:hypothetical protein